MNGTVFRSKIKGHEKIGEQMNMSEQVMEIMTDEEETKKYPKREREFANDHFQL